MSIDKTPKSDKVEPNTVIWFGIFKGSVPLKLIKGGNVEGINYLIWMRTVRNEKGFPRFLFNEDLHHIVDDVIRKNNALFGKNETRFSESDYNVWLAEKRLQRKKREIEKEEQANRKRKELAEFQEKERLKDQEMRRRKEAYLDKLATEREKARLANLQRAEFYAEAWAAW